MKRTILSLSIFTAFTAVIIVCELLYSSAFSKSITGAVQNAKESITEEKIEAIERVLEKHTLINSMFFKHSVLERLQKETAELRIAFSENDSLYVRLALERIEIYANSLKNVRIL